MLPVAGFLKISRLHPLLLEYNFLTKLVSFQTTNRRDCQAFGVTNMVNSHSILKPLAIRNPDAELDVRGQFASYNRTLILT